jgi:hypothetical protein
MAVQSLPLFGDGLTAYRYTITIQGTAYIFGFVYAERHDSWYLSIYDRNLTPIRTGIRIVIGWPLNLRDIDSRLFGGLLVALRMDNQGDTPPTIDSFDGHITLLLISGDDIPVSPGTSESLTVEAVEV